jgi:hypothetical protein
VTDNCSWNGPHRLRDPLPRRAAARLRVTGLTGTAAYWLTCHGCWRGAMWLYKACGLW